MIDSSPAVLGLLEIAVFGGQQLNQDNARDEATGVGEEGDTADVGLSETGESTDELDRHPIAEHPLGGNLLGEEDEAERDERGDGGVGEFDDVGAHDARDGSAGAKHGE